MQIYDVFIMYFYFLLLLLFFNTIDYAYSLYNLFIPKSELMVKYYFLISTLFFLSGATTAQVSLNMNLLDQWHPTGLSYNDVWGYADAAGNEYAIVGSYSKIHFLQITNSNTLTLIDEFTPGSTSIWRDFKTYGNYAYAVTEGTEGLLVYDLSDLPNSVTLSSQNTNEFTKAHNIYIDEANGKLYVVGSNTQNNGLIIYDVTTNPPTHLASVALPAGGYVHDIYVRGDTAYCSHGYNGFYIWDVSTPSSPSFLASYTGEAGYNHSSWVSPDGNTAYYAREVGVGLPMTILDLSDYNDLSVISNFKFPLLAPTYVDNVPHNPYLLGDYLISSYYEDGVQVFEVSDPTNVSRVAYYDTYPSNTQYNGYHGCWGVYPYLPSGKILASDGSNGLFLLELTINLPLPVEFSSFDVKIKKEGIQLTWTTETEKDNDFFEIEKSKDGEHFFSIKKITGRGNSTTTQHYNFLDKNPI
ncbi:MAG TPA: choice-of-anchor B family protein, partial [Phaeodactylibacter sp.]|nr:choice-of-anchor B family protein [Phaeodactylibacter sp.]